MGSPEPNSGMFWSISLFWLVTGGFCHSNRGDAINSASGGFLDSVKLIQGDLEDAVNVDTCGIVITGGLSGEETYPWATQTTEVIGKGSLPSLPYPRSGHLSLIDGQGEVLVCGGFIKETNDGEIRDSCCYVLDQQEGNWKLHSMLPWGWLARLSFVMASGVSLEDGIYVVGFLAIDETFHQYAHLPRGSNEWQLGNISMGGIPLHIGPSACSVAISAHQILVIGGQPHDDEIEAHRVIEFDSHTGAWSIWGLLSVPYIGHACALMGDSLIISGGILKDGSTSSSTTIVDIATKTERQGGELNIPRAGFGMATLDGKLLAFGGDTDFFSDYEDPDTGPLENLTDSIEEWDSVEEKWVTSETRLEEARAAFGYLVKC